jgi:polysaccharide biosynthesis protein PslH
MRILYIVPYTPNLVRVRPYNLIRALYGRNHQITLLTLREQAREQADINALRPYCDAIYAFPLSRRQAAWNCLTAVPGRMPLQAVYAWNRPLADKAVELLTRKGVRPAFDLIHVEHLRGVQYALHLQKIMAERGLTTPVVWDSVDCISFLFRQAAERSQTWRSRWTTRFELGRTARMERRLLRRFARILVASPADQAAYFDLESDLNAQTPPPVAVLPNGVDVDYFQPGFGEREPAEIVVSGKMSYHANVSMTLNLVHNIIPAVWEQRPDVRLTIVGRDPPRELLALADDPAITVTGGVPDLRPFLQRATIAVAPTTYGAGIQNKVLEAMACAAPVIASPQAVAALNVVDGRDLLIGRTHAEFSAKIVTLLRDAGGRQAVGLAGRDYILTHHQWTQIACQLEQIYDEILFAFSPSATGESPLG